MLYNDSIKKSAQVIASKDDTTTKVFRLDQMAYCGIVQSESKQQDEEKLKLLEKVPFLKDSLPKDKEERSKLCSIMETISFHKDKQIVANEKAAEDTFYVVEEGAIKITSDKNQMFR